MLGMSIADVRKAQRAYEAIHERDAALRAARDAAVRAALEERIPQAEIMDATGLSRARLAQIKRGTR
jgi:hypothetical protein